ncbi:glycosyltransferase family 4 protein [Gracilibacillus kekensis]|uniref:Glycosyltransferase involved in cell wall bisynthesis n=1 Tax=Gracilibacillus kekensis TaxID=1027249 RepID=A0A1M7K2T3_9BACI|nr:glycosyltransferase family 4 protein [Gracilibacillus kekensis]SHM59589.1 Glycosyltransferase involved in cell wall bisynthesis [Gracilibacillus kekensis]
MNVLFLMLNYPFDKKREHMYKDLSREFAKQGHNVYVAALLENKNGNETFVQKEENHQILWIKAGNYFEVNKFRKGLTALLLPLYFNNAIDKHFKGIHFDLVIYPTPAITLYYTVKNLKQKYKDAKYLLVVKDIFPQNALDINMIKRGPVYSFFRNIEKKIYNISDYLGCMSQQNIEYLKAHNDINEQKFFILENWSSVYTVNKPTDRALENLKNKYELNQKFVCTFGGNISPANELEFLIELADKLHKENINDVQFLIIGKGIAKNKIKEILKRKKLPNVKMYDFVPTEEYDQLLALSDVGLVNLNRNYTIPNIPSKTLNLMRIGKPVLAATDARTDYDKLITEDANCGLWCETGDIGTYYRNFMSLKDSKSLREQFSKNARHYFEQYLTTEKAYQNIIKKIGE